MSFCPILTTLSHHVIGCRWTQTIPDLISTEIIPWQEVTLARNTVTWRLKRQWCVLARGGSWWCSSSPLSGGASWFIYKVPSCFFFLASYNAVLSPFSEGCFTLTWMDSLIRLSNRLSSLSRICTSWSLTVWELSRGVCWPVLRQALIERLFNPLHTGPYTPRCTWLHIQRFSW